MKHNPKTSGEDRVFDDPDARIKDFKFDDQVADVFDNMVGRSVPFYDEIQRMSCQLAADFAIPHTNLYDIGCATATTLQALDAKVDPSVRFIGLDNSEEMLARAREKMAAGGSGRETEFVAADLHHDFTIENASVATMILTLQFARPLHRGRIMRTIADGLNDQGCLILVEKLTCEHSVFNRLFIDHYYDYKRQNGYSDTEIAKKREALENVLIPYRVEENFELLHESGFQHVEEFFRWFNFCGIVAVK